MGSLSPFVQTHIFNVSITYDWLSNQYLGHVTIWLTFVYMFDSCTRCNGSNWTLLLLLLLLFMLSEILHTKNQPWQFTVYYKSLTSKYLVVPRRGWVSAPFRELYVLPCFCHETVRVLGLFWIHSTRQICRRHWFSIAKSTNRKYKSRYGSFFTSFKMPQWT